KLALVLLLLIGFYRISDIIAGVISNVFYQDLNFSKEQIAEAVKVYGVIFSLVGGFLGGLLAQRMNIMKLMFVGAVLASSTNLIFIGLVKSGQPLNDVTVIAGGQTYTVQPDETGAWKLKVPVESLKSAQQIQVEARYLNDDSVPVTVAMPYLNGADTTQLLLLPVTADNLINANESQNSVVVRGQFAQALNENQKIQVTLDGKPFEAKLDKEGIFSVAISGDALAQSPSQSITAQLLEGNKIQNSVEHRYKVNTVANRASTLDIDIQPMNLAITDDQGQVELKGKVIKSYSSLWLYFAIIIDNLASGLAGAAFIAFLSSLTSVSFTAVQYAIFSSLMTLTPKILGGYSGTIVSNIGYPKFFLMTTLIGIPILFLVVWVGRLLRDHNNAQLNRKGE
ncbi:MAG: MFS transporter, partial [Acinetobacter sp.]|nr:MFS transporter [Acinetobacter sp.]